MESKVLRTRISLHFSLGSEQVTDTRIWQNQEDRLVELKEEEELISYMPIFILSLLPSSFPEVSKGHDISSTKLILDFLS